MLNLPAAFSRIHVWNHQDDEYIYILENIVWYKSQIDIEWRQKILNNTTSTNGTHSTLHPLYCISAKPLHNSDTVSVHFNHFYCTDICDKLRKDLAMLTYIYLNVDECWLTSSMRQQRFKLQISLHYANIEQNTFSWGVVDGHVSFNLVGVHITLVLPYHVYSINNDRRIACMLDWIKTI